MAIYKTSNHSPNLEEVDLSQNNSFSCMVNTSGESIVAYKMQILSGRGDEKIYGPEEPTQLSKPVKNKGVLKIDNINNSIAENFVNGKDYQWGVRVYNQAPYATTQPNTLVCEGFLVGSTKYVIWCKIPDQTESNKDIVDQIMYDRYIEFNTTSDRMTKGAKDDVSIELPDTSKKNYIERRKIDWVTKELGYNKNIVKIETEKEFTYNYIDGTEFKIFQCSDEHTLKSFFADPNSNINVSNYIVLFNDAAAAKAAHDKGYKPSLSDIGEGTGGGSTADNMFGSPKKIVGYSSDTGEIRVGDAYSSEPKNGFAYLIFEYDSVNKTCNEVLPTIANDAQQQIKDNPYLTQVVGGREITSSFYTVMTNRWDNIGKRMFIQPNINIKSDETNPNELVFDNGTRIDIAKQYWMNNGVEVDITFDKLDNSQWLLTIDSDGKNESGFVPTSIGTPPVIPQTNYKIYTDFMDSMPFNVFYARTTPTMEIQYRDLNKQERLEKDGEPDEVFTYFDGKYFKQDLEKFFLINKEYEKLDENYINSPNYPTSLKEDGYFPSIQDTDYYNSVLDMLGNYIYDLVIRYKNAPTSITAKDIEAEIALLYKTYNTTGIPLRNIQFNTQFNAPDKQTIKYYHYYLYAYKDYSPELIAQSEDIYNTDLIWNYRGFLSETKYNIKISVIDEYDKEFIQSVDFNIIYGTEKASAPLGVEFDCEKKAIKITASSPEYVIPTLPNLKYLTLDEKAQVGKTIQLDAGQICYILDNGNYEVWDGAKFVESDITSISESNVHYDEKGILDDYVEIKSKNQMYYDTVVDDRFPETKIQIPVNFSLLTQFQITKDFVNNIPLTFSNNKQKIAELGYEFFNADKYKLKGITVQDIIIEEVRFTLPTQAKIGDIRYLFGTNKDGYYIYSDTGWQLILTVEENLPQNESDILNKYKNYCCLNNSITPKFNNGCYKYVNNNWVYLPQLTPEKYKKEYSSIDLIYHFDKGITYGNVPYSQGNYLWKDYSFIAVDVSESLNVSKTVLLEDNYYYFSYELNQEFYGELNDYFVVNKSYQNIKEQDDVVQYFNSLKDNKQYQNEILIDIYNASINIQNSNKTSEEINRDINDYVYIITEKYNDVPLDPNKKQKGIYYDGNYYNGYYLWKDGGNNEYKNLELFLTSCKQYAYDDGIMIKNINRCHLELYENSNSLPLKCWVMDDIVNPSNLHNYTNLLDLGVITPIPEKYKFAIQNNENNQYQYANNLLSNPREGEIYRIYVPNEKEIALLSEEDSMPIEDSQGRPYGVYIWSKDKKSWVLDPTEYCYLNNVYELDGYGIVDGNGKSYDSMTLEQKYDFLSIPENCRCRIDQSRQIETVYSDGGLTVYPENSNTFSDPIIVFDGLNTLSIVDSGMEEDNWSYDIFTNSSNGKTIIIQIQKEGDVLWNYGGNSNNIWIDTTAYSGEHIATVLNKIWLSLYLVATYDENVPIKGIIKIQEKWEG